MHQLALNYRSTPSILAVGIHLLGQGDDTAGTLPKALVPTKPDDGHKVQLWRLGTANDEAEAIALVSIGRVGGWVGGWLDGCLDYGKYKGQCGSFDGAAIPVVML